MRNHFLFMGIISALSFTSCSHNDINEISTNNKGICFNIPDFHYEIPSRTLVDITDNAAVFTWGANDTIGIFPDSDASQARFVMTSGAGTKSATFDGGGWALKAQSKYASYYPYIADINLDKSNIPISYQGQVQNSNGNTSHLGAYDFMSSTATVPNSGEVSFDFNHLGVLLQMKFTMPNEDNYTSITLKSDEKIFISKGSYNLMSNEISITPTLLEDSMVLSLVDVSTTSSNPLITAYLMLPPMNLSNHEVSVIVRKDNSTSATGKLALKNFIAGTAYSLSSTLSSPENGSTDQEVIEITKAGTLEKLLGESKFMLEKLAIKGNINSDDIATIRRMSGGFRDTTDVEFGVLKELDLSNASIVTGGSYYMDNGDSRYRISNPNQISSCMFFGCTSLESLILPNNVTLIDEAAMSSCYNLSYVIIPSGVTSIGVAAFNGCKRLKQIELPQSLSTLGSDVFHSCESLQSIEIPSGIKTIGVNSFGHCKSLTHVVLSEGLEKIDNAAFAVCDNLESISIPNTVKEMGERVFASCTSLKHVDLSSKQSIIMPYTFENCTALQTIIIPEGVETIQSRAFQYCLNITDITLPSTLKTIGDRAFYAVTASSPITVKCAAITPPSLGTNIWKGGNNVSGSILYVLPDNVNAYQSSSWKNYFGQILSYE